MIDKIIGTFLSRLLAMVIMLVVVILNTNTFGATGTGTIGLIILGLTILQILGNFIGGAAIVYLIPRRNNFQIIFLSYLWALFSNIAGVIILTFFHLIPEGYEWQLLLLSLASSFFFINITVMQGKEDIRRFNFYQISQLALLIIIYAGILIVFKYTGITPKVSHYIYSFTLSYFLPAAISFIYIIRNVGEVHFRNIRALLVEMSKFGAWVQLANLAQLMNYRLSYYFIEWYAGRQPLGIYELGTKLSEVVWIFPKSICLVQYARLANNRDSQYAKQLTLSLLKIVFIFAILAVTCLLLIPESWLAGIFGAEFGASKSVIFRLAPGIVFLSCLSILAHYFSGYGKYWINTLASMSGFLVTLVLGLLLIPQAAAIGTLRAIEVAASINSLSYFVSFLFTLLFFIFATKSKFSEFILNKQDILLFKKEVIGGLLSRLKHKKA